MSTRLDVHLEWLDSIGYSPHVWLRGDWHQPLHLLSKLLADELNKRRPMNSADNVTFKIGFNTMLQLAEEMLGIPCLITEKDLMIQYPNITLAMLVYLICVKHSVDFIDTKSLRNIVAPKLVFEARNVGDAQLPRCASCSEHVFIIERVVIEACVWHRHCFKCVQCSAVMRIGGFRKGKKGYECITHAVRRILDAMDEKRSIRPQIAPPEVPSANPPNVESSSRTNTLKSSLPPPISPKPKFASSWKPSPPPKPAGLLVSKEQRTATVTKDFKPTELSNDYEIVSVGSENSGDSGIVMRAQNLSIDADVDGYEVVSQLQSASSMAVAEMSTPVPPPRPKRASVILTNSGVEAIPTTDMDSSRAPTVTEKPSTGPYEITRSNSHNKSNSRIISRWFVMEHFPDSSCVFDESDEVSNGDSKNPFDDSEDECETSLAHTVSRILTSASALPGESDRPKCTPPPPPLISSSFPDKVDKNEINVEERFRTLKVSSKPTRTLRPPMVVRGKEVFTENKGLEGTDEIKKKLERLDVDLTKIMRVAKQLEVEITDMLNRFPDPSDWLKMPRTEDFIEVMCKFLDLLRETNTLQFMWREAFLNEIHSETECILRRIISKETRDEKAAEREKQLMDLLIFIIDEKAKLSEENIEDRAINTSSMQKRDLKKRKHKLQMALLSKKK